MWATDITADAEYRRHEPGGGKIVDRIQDGAALGMRPAFASGYEQAPQRDEAGGCTVVGLVPPRSDVGIEQARR